MSRITPLEFQEKHIQALVQRFTAQRDNYTALTNKAELSKLRLASAAVMLQAPTGIGKTLIATETVSRFSKEEQVIWLWFAPFAGLVSQGETSLRVQAPQLKILNIEHERNPDELAPGAVFVITWQTVAARTRESRLARQSSDAGLAVDDLIFLAREQGFRIGVVVDEAHHGFVKAKEAHRFFTEVLEPDYALLMTATPKDVDVAAFTEKTGYKVGGPEDWATITRNEGYMAGLLKRGVKAARFITKNEDDARLVDFEEVALSECKAMHQHIKKTLVEAGISLTPLMLVQVPNGGAAIEKAKRYLIDTLHFPESAVRVHVSEEPDPNLLALAQDPTVEVIVFKMAIAMGFDAPRAFTLAALRGTRSSEFGIQVVGRIMRVHRALQHKPGLPEVLAYGYVFLANSEAQEGLTSAASAINSLKEHTSAVTPNTVVTFTADDSSFVQVVKDGQSLSLLPDQEPPSPAVTSETTPPPEEPVPPNPAPTLQLGILKQLTLLKSLSTAQLAHGDQPSKLVQAFALDAQQEPHKYSKHNDVPESLVTEVLPKTPEDIELQLVSFIDFAAVLADRSRSRTKLLKRTTEIFSAATPDDEDIWAKMSIAGIAAKARQIAFEFGDVDRRSFLAALKQRFTEALEKGGHEMPNEAETLTQQLELILVRNPGLIRQAHKRCRADQITTANVMLPVALVSEIPLQTTKRSVYRVMPPDMSPDETRFAELLDTDPAVLWWHRNPASKPYSVGLFRWSDGIGFFPDFVVAVKDRKVGGGIALVEFKGPHLQQYDKMKAGAAHAVYGRAFMVGYSKERQTLRLFRLVGEDLVDDGPFEAGRLRYE